eukprot:scaffold216174_cov13-Tisochrysis_lutea.AAC.1
MLAMIRACCNDKNEGAAAELGHRGACNTLEHSTCAVLMATWEHFKYERSLTAGMGAAPLDSKPSRGLFLSGRFHWHFNA